MKIKTLLLAAVALLAIASCDNKKREVLGVMLDPTEIYLAKEAGSSADIQVLASEKWSIKSNADWLEISQPSGKGDATVSVKAKDANNGKPRKATVTFRCGYYHYATLTITQQGTIAAGDGKTKETAFTASEAHAFVLEGEFDASASYFVKGKIHKIGQAYSASGTNGNASFYISDDGAASTEDFYCYRVLYLNNKKFASGDTDVKVGDDVIIYGQVTLYNGTTETVQNAAFLYQLNDKESEIQTEFEEISIAEFLQKKDENTEYIVSGKVTSVTPSGSYYGATISDGTNSLQCAFPTNWTSWSDKVKNGGTLKIRGKYSVYNGTPQLANGTVLDFTEGQVITVDGTVSDAVAAEDAAEVTIKDAYVAALTTKGFVVTDGTNNLYVYANAAPTVKIGDKIGLKGTKTTYYGLPELTSPSDITTASQGNTVPRTELKDITATVDSYDSSKADYLSFTGTLAKDGNYYNFTKSGATWKLSASQPTSDLTSIMDGLNNQQVTVTGYFNTKNTGKSLINIIVTGVEGASGSYCTTDKDEYEVRAEATSATINITANAAWTLTPPATGGVTLSASSGSANAAVTASFAANTSAQEVVYELVLACQAASVNKTITIKQGAAGASTGDTVTEAVAKQTTDGADVSIDNAIVAALTTKGFVITDGTTNCYVYQNAAPSVKLGDKVALSGKMKTYYKLPEVTNPANIEVLTSGNDIPRTSLVDVTESVDSYDATAAEYITFTGNLLKDGNYYNIKKTGATVYVSASYPSADITSQLDALNNQDVIITGYYNTKNTSKGYLGLIVTEVKAADPNAKYCRVTEGNSINVEASATSTTLHVVANAAWTLTASAGATVSPASGSADAAVTVSFAANTDSQAKTYTLTLSCPDASVNQAITITQAKASSGGATLVYTLDGTITGGSNGYATESDITQNSILWKVMGNTTQSPWRIGGKGVTNEKRTVYSQNAIASNISEIKFTYGTADGCTVNSTTVTVHSSAADAASGSNPKATFNPSFAANSSVSVEKSGSDSWAGCFYRIVYDITVTNTSSNKFFQLSKIEFYGN